MATRATQLFGTAGIVDATIKSRPLVDVDLGERSIPAVITLSTETPGSHVFDLAWGADGALVSDTIVLNQRRLVLPVRGSSFRADSFYLTGVGGLVSGFLAIGERSERAVIMDGTVSIGAGLNTTILGNSLPTSTRRVRVRRSANVDFRFALTAANGVGVVVPAGAEMEWLEVESGDFVINNDGAVLATFEIWCELDT